jgi:hypothetical protein
MLMVSRRLIWVPCPQPVENEKLVLVPPCLTTSNGEPCGSATVAPPVSDETVTRTQKGSPTETDVRSGDT